MKMADVFPTKYISAGDLKDREVTVVIGETKMEKVGDDQKPVVYFQGKTKGLALNKTNFGRITFINGSDDTDDWTGTEITLYTEMVDYQGKPVDAVRVKKPAKKGAPVQKAAPVAEPDDMEDSIPF